MIEHYYLYTMKETTCIRILADVKQINSCKKRIGEVDKKVNYLSEAMSLAGNAVRLKILFLLHEEGQLCVCDLSDILNMKIAAISQHLRKLKDGNIIRNRKDGQTIFYSLNAEYRKLLFPFFELIEGKKKLEMT